MEEPRILGTTVHDFLSLVGGERFQAQSQTLARLHTRPHLFQRPPHHPSQWPTCRRGQHPRHLIHLLPTNFKFYLSRVHSNCHQTELFYRWLNLSSAGIVWERRNCDRCISSTMPSTFTWYGRSEMYRCNQFANFAFKQNIFFHYIHPSLLLLTIKLLYKAMCAFQPPYQIIHMTEG